MDFSIDLPSVRRQTLALPECTPGVQYIGILFSTPISYELGKWELSPEKGLSLNKINSLNQLNSFELYIEHILEYLLSDIQGPFDHFPHFLLSYPHIQVPTRPHPASLLRLDEIGHIQSDTIIDLLSYFMLKTPTYLQSKKAMKTSINAESNTQVPKLLTRSILVRYRYLH